MRRRLLMLVVLAAALAAPSLSARQKLTADDLFDNSQVQRLDLFINTRDFATLQELYQTNDYYPADLVFRGQRVRNVGVRSRGSGSRNSKKLGLKIEFNHYTTGQQFLGLDSLVLDNLYQDPSMFRENLAMTIFRRLGQVASRESFCRLYINNQYYGFYGVVESVDPGFVTRNLGETGGYLYEFKYVRLWLMEDLGNNLSEYAAFFDPQDHKTQSDVELYGPIRDLIKEINGPDDAVWSKRVTDRVDVEQFMTHVAVQQFLGNGDGFLGSFGINNFYLYRFANTTRHRFIPWDEDRSLDFLDASILRHYDGGYPVLFGRALDRPDMKRVFLNVLDQCADMAEKDNWLANEIERLIGLTGSRDDPNNPFSQAQYDQDIAGIRGFAQHRPQQVRDEVAIERGR